MKQITNWRQASIADFEADGLLDAVTKIHTMSYQIREQNGELSRVFTIRRDHKDYAQRVAKFFQYHIDKGIPVVMHNGIGYDVKMVEKILGIDLTKLMVIDTLALSWYLSPERNLHGLDSFFGDYGIAKPTIEHWEQQEGETLGQFLDSMEHRCTEDVKINTALWEDHMARLVDMYTIAQHAIDFGQEVVDKHGNVTYLPVGGKRQHEKEWIPIDDMVGRGVDQAIDSILTFLMFKMDCAALQETTRWKVDVEHCTAALAKLEEIVTSAREGLAAVMPKVPKYVKKTQPKSDPFRKNGDRSAIWAKWDIVMKQLEDGEKDPETGAPMVYIDPGDGCDPDGKQFYRVWNKNEEPNPGSPAQVKDFLFSKGWVPQTFKYEKDEEAFNAWIARKPKEGAKRGAWTLWKESRPEERAIPQISVAGDDGKELCPSLEELAEEVPAIKVYADYKVAENRRNTLKGFMRDLSEDGYLQARIGGFTNTLRVQHRELVNLPGTDKPYGYDIRGSLIAGFKKVLAGSDMSSLEDRVKHHFMLPHDPEYVATMQSPDFDPHILMALTAKMITQKEFDDFKAGIKSANAKAARKKGKTCLPVDNTEVLTKRGWVNGVDVVVGDQVMSLNVETNTTEWTDVTDTMLFSDQETVVLKNQNWELESTADHKWVVCHTTGRGHTRRKERKWISTDKLSKAMSIVTTAPYVGGFSNITEEQAAVIGWVLADGYLDVSEPAHKTSQGLQGQRQAVRMSIAQAKFYDEVKANLESCNLEYFEYKNSSGVPVFQISSPSAREFLTAVGLPLKNKHEIDYESWLTNLSYKSLEAFYKAFWLADGQTKGVKYKTKVIYQNRGKIADAVHLCSVLLGRTTLANGADYCTIRSQNRSTVTMQKVSKECKRKVDVFCLTTNNTTFMIRQNGFVTVTGNCNYASVYNAGAAKIAQAAGVPLEEGQALHKAYWELNWAVKAIADEQVVIKDSRGGKWLVNPVNGFCYSLRKESDRFSTLAQGTGSFFFDMWVDNILTAMENEWNVRRLTGSFHDECIICMGDTEENRQKLGAIIKAAVEKVNTDFNLRRLLDCETQYGINYAQIH